MTTDAPVFIAPVETVAPVCSRCGQMLWQSPAAELIDSRGRTRCPARWWQRLLAMGGPHTTDSLGWAEVGRVMARAALVATGLYVAAELAVTLVSLWL